MKKFIASITVLTLLLGLCACAAAQPESQSAEASQGPTWQEQYDLGVRYLSEGNYEEAVLAFTAAIEIDPKRAPAYVGRGDAYVLSGETEDNLAAAKADYEKAIELDKTSAEAYLGLADVYIRQGDYEKALEILRVGLEKTGGAQSIQNKISEIEDTYVSDIVEENPVIALVREGDSGNMLRADEVTFWGYNPESVMFSEAEQILKENGFYCEYNFDGTLLGHKEKNADGLFGPLAIVNPSDNNNFIQAFSFDELLGVGIHEEKYGPINIGLRDICTTDSPETVFSKLGFTNATELADFMIFIHGLPFEEQEQHFKDIHYYNAGFGVDSPGSRSSVSWDFCIFLQGASDSPYYSISFTFLNISNTDTYQLSRVYCFIYNRN